MTKPGDIIINSARDGLPVFQILTAVDAYGSCKAARLGGKRTSKVTLYPACLPPHLKVQGA
jgi:hypothetical protein